MLLFCFQTPIFRPKLPYELEILNLEDNRLTNLDSIALLKFVKNSTIGLKNNLFSCEYLSRFIEQWHELKFANNVWEQRNMTTVDCQEKSKNLTNSSTSKISDPKMKPTEIGVFIVTAHTIDESPNKFTTTEAANIELHHPTETKVLVKQNEQNANHFEYKTSFKSVFKDLRHFNISGSHLNDTVELIEMLGEPLESLDVSLNFVGVIKNGTFSAFVNLQHLNLSRTNLSIIESNALQHLNKLRTLDLSYNYLDNLDFLFAFGSSDQLETLILEGNRLPTPDFILPINNQFPNLKKFEYINDQFSCESVIEYLGESPKLFSTKEAQDYVHSQIALQVNLLRLLCALKHLALAFNPEYNFPY